MALSAPVSARLNILACEPEWAALATSLGGEHVTAYSATTAFQDPHYIEARPSLIAKTRTADLLVCTGAELEVGWLPVLLRQSGNAVVQDGAGGHFLAAQQVERIEIPTVLDRSQGDVHASGNPHVHWDPYRLLSIAQSLSERLIALDGTHAAYYKRRYQAFAEKWHRQIVIWEKQAAMLKGKKAIVHHKNWSYLLDWLGINMVGDLEPKPGLPPTSAHLSQLLQTVRKTEIDFILIANHQNDQGAQWLGNKSAIPVISLPFTVGGSETAKDLITLYDEVIQQLITAITP
jgi:zinc/manganese transport system substrate-binding protein